MAERQQQQPSSPSSSPTDDPQPKPKKSLMKDVQFVFVKQGQNDHQAILKQPLDDPEVVQSGKVLVEWASYSYESYVPVSDVQTGYFSDDDNNNDDRDQSNGGSRHRRSSRRRTTRTTRLQLDNSRQKQKRSKSQPPPAPNQPQTQPTKKQRLENRHSTGTVTDSAVVITSSEKEDKSANLVHGSTVEQQQRLQKPQIKVTKSSSLTGSTPTKRSATTTTTKSQSSTTVKEHPQNEREKKQRELVNPTIPSSSSSSNDLLQNKNPIHGSGMLNPNRRPEEQQQQPKQNHQKGHAEPKGPPPPPPKPVQNESITSDKVYHNHDHQKRHAGGSKKYNGQQEQQKERKLPDAKKKPAIPHQDEGHDEQGQHKTSRQQERRVESQPVAATKTTTSTTTEITNESDSSSYISRQERHLPGCKAMTTTTRTQTSSRVKVGMLPQQDSSRTPKKSNVLSTQMFGSTLASLSAGNATAQLPPPPPPPPPGHPYLPSYYGRRLGEMLQRHPPPPKPKSSLPPPPPPPRRNYNCSVPFYEHMSQSSPPPLPPQSPPPSPPQSPPPLPPQGPMYVCSSPPLPPMPIPAGDTTLKETETAASTIEISSTIRQATEDTTATAAAVVTATTTLCEASGDSDKSHHTTSKPVDAVTSVFEVPVASSTTYEIPRKMAGAVTSVYEAPVANNAARDRTSQLADAAATEGVISGTDAVTSQSRAKTINVTKALEESVTSNHLSRGENESRTDRSHLQTGSIVTELAQQPSTTNLGTETSDAAMNQSTNAGSEATNVAENQSINTNPEDSVVTDNKSINAGTETTDAATNRSTDSNSKTTDIAENQSLSHRTFSVSHVLDLLYGPNRLPRNAPSSKQRKENSSGRKPSSRGTEDKKVEVIDDKNNASRQREEHCTQIFSVVDQQPSHLPPPTRDDSQSKSEGPDVQSLDNRIKISSHDTRKLKACCDSEAEKSSDIAPQHVTINIIVEETKEDKPIDSLSARKGKATVERMEENFRTQPTISHLPKATTNAPSFGFTNESGCRKGKNPMSNSSPIMNVGKERVQRVSGRPTVKSLENESSMLAVSRIKVVPHHQKTVEIEVTSRSNDNGPSRKGNGGVVKATGIKPEPQISKCPHKTIINVASTDELPDLQPTTSLAGRSLPNLQASSNSIYRINTKESKGISDRTTEKKDSVRALMNKSVAQRTEREEVPKPLSSQISEPPSSPKDPKTKSHLSKSKSAAKSVEKPAAKTVARKSMVFDTGIAARKGERGTSGSLCTTPPPSPPPPPKRQKQLNHSSQGAANELSASRSDRGGISPVTGTKKKKQRNAPLEYTLGSGHGICAKKNGDSLRKHDKFNDCEPKKKMHLFPSKSKEPPNVRFQEEADIAQVSNIGGFEKKTTSPADDVYATTSENGHAQARIRDAVTTAKQKAHSDGTTPYKKRMGVKFKKPRNRTSVYKPTTDDRISDQSRAQEISSHDNAAIARKTTEFNDRVNTSAASYANESSGQTFTPSGRKASAWDETENVFNVPFRRGADFRPTIPWTPSNTVVRPHHINRTNFDLLFEKCRNPYVGKPNSVN